MAKKWLCGVIIAVALLGMPARSSAQGCSVCSKTAADRGEKSARGLNGGILYLALLPLAIMGTLGGIWWKNYKNSI